MATGHRAAVADVSASPDRSPDWVPLADGTTADRRPRSPSVRRVVGRFLVANLIAVVLLLAGGAWAGIEAAEGEALADARRTTDLMAALLVEPNIDDGLLVGDPQAIADLDTKLPPRLAAIGVIRVKIWNADGQIVYSDEPRLIGTTYPLDDDDRQALRDGVTRAEVSDLASPENRFERSFGRLLEVYREIDGPGGEPLLLETYSAYQDATARQFEIWWDFVPISAAVVLTLVAVQLPLATRMVRQLRAAQRERELLQERALDASTEERRRIAGSLHDGIVQDVSASALLVARAGDELRSNPDGGPSRQLADVLGEAAAALRASVGSLRSLLVEIYPPNLEQAGLPMALTDLAGRLRPRGVDVRVSVPDHLDPPPAPSAVVLRTVQEALRNVVKHSGARTVDVTLVETDGGLVLEVTDDGVGFAAAPVLAGPGTGHLGLRLLADLAATHGARLCLRTAPGAGTTLRLEVPLP